MKGSEFVFHYVHLLYYVCHKITKIKLFINKYNWKGIDFLSKKDDWKKFEKNNKKMALNVLYPKKKKYTQLIFQNITQIVKTKLFF